MREALARDLEEIHEMQKESAQENGTWGYREDDMAVLKANLGHYFLVAEKDRCIVGFIYGWIEAAKDIAIMRDGERYLHVEELHVKEPFRRQGIGSRLMEALLAAARKDGIAHARVYSARKDLSGVIRFYEKHGFKTWYMEMFR